MLTLSWASLCRSCNAMVIHCKVQEASQATSGVYSLCPTLKPTSPWSGPSSRWSAFAAFAAYRMFLFVFVADSRGGRGRVARGGGPSSRPGRPDAVAAAETAPSSSTVAESSAEESGWGAPASQAQAEGEAQQPATEGPPKPHSTWNGWGNPPKQTKSAAATEAITQETPKPNGTHEAAVPVAQRPGPEAEAPKEKPAAKKVVAGGKMSWAQIAK